MAIPLILAPVLGKLFESGLDMLGKAVMAKGKDVIEEKLGIDIEEAAKTEEGLYKLKALEVQHEQFLQQAAQQKAELDFKVFQAEVDDRKSARSMNQDAIKSEDVFIRRFVPALTIGLLVCGFSYVVAVTFFNIPEANQTTALTILGWVLGTMLTAPLAFYFGTTASSKRKDETIGNLSEKP